ncbi:MAG: plastocyanin/azurin family copper-binding protein [Acidimicrobiia bacterium]
MRRRILGALGTLLCAGLLFAACGGDSGSSSGGGYTPPKGPSVQTLEIKASNFQFDPDKIDAKSGITTIKLTDGGGIHTLVFEDAFSGFQLEVSGGGDSSSGKVDLAAGKKYVFYCNITGHRQQGMEGTITVK